MIGGWSGEGGGSRKDFQTTFKRIFKSIFKRIFKGLSKGCSNDFQKDFQKDFQRCVFFRGGVISHILGTPAAEKEQETKHHYYKGKMKTKRLPKGK